MNRCMKVIPFLLIMTPIALAPVALAQGAGSMFRYSFVSPNLYCLDFGYYDAARAAGITGFDINPAGLARMKNVSFATAYSSSKRAAARINVQIVPDSFYFGKVQLPIDLGFQETGGWDFLGGGGRIGPVAFGVGFRRGDMVGVAPAIDTIVDQYWAGSMPFVLSHEVFPQIPAALGYIPVIISAAGNGRLHFTIDGNGTITTRPISFGAALDLGSTAVGLGGTVNVYQGSANIAGWGDGHFTNITGKVTAMPYVTPWSVDINFSGSAEDDSIYRETFTGNVTGAQLSLRLGGQTTVKNLILGELELGGVVEEVFPAAFAGGFVNHLVYASASGVPTDIAIDTNQVQLIIDPVHLKITGTIKAALSNISKTTSNDSTANPFRLPPQTNVHAAGVYRLEPWEFNLGAGMTGFVPTGQGWGRIYVDGGVRLHRFIDWHLGAVCAWQRYQIASYSVTTPPIVVAGLGGTARLFGAGLDFAIRTNTTALILRAISATEQVELPGFNPLDWISFGLGLKFDL